MGYLYKKIMKDKIKQLLSEVADTTEKDKEKEAGSKSSEYKKVQDLLGNDIFNHAAIVKKLWGSKNATNRSKFRKKLHQETTESGETHLFTGEELSKIIQILTDTSVEIRKNVGGVKISKDN
jgi:RNA polymerase-interacting CarD/CdnL/TRCF family regulator